MLILCPSNRLSACLHNLIKGVEDIHNSHFDSDVMKHVDYSYGLYVVVNIVAFQHSDCSTYLNAIN
jgi:hypothetical protein